MLDLLRSPRFADLAPAEVYATLLDQGVYHCSISTMYRILAENSDVRERRRQLRHPAYTKPELLAVTPNQVWSWDITKLKGPAKWTYFYLYVILDIFSRRVVGWCIADAENASVFKELFDDTISKHDVPPGQLTLHADRGGPMKAKATAFLLADLGVTKSHSRPHVSNDNPFSERHFKTLTAGRCSASSGTRSAFGAVRTRTVTMTAPAPSPSRYPAVTSSPLFRRRTSTPAKPPTCAGRSISRAGGAAGGHAPP